MLDLKSKKEVNWYFKGKFPKRDCKVLSSSADKATIAGGSSKIDLWHQRLPQVNLRQLHLIQLVPNSEGVDVQLEGGLSFCEACVQGKMHWLPHPPIKDFKSKESL